MQLKVKDFAAQQGVSESIVYRHIRQNREALGDRIVKAAKATWITDEGQDYLRNLMIQNPIVIGDSKMAEDLAEAKEQIEQLRREKEKLYQETLKIYKLAEEKQRLIDEAKANQLLLEEKREEIGKLREENDKQKAEVWEANQKATASDARAEAAEKAAEEAEKARKAAEDELKDYKALPWYKKLFGGK